ncbi:MAG TPA: GNAT family N-acetyltransferase [Candidatus Limnocylindria bacterium]
MPLDIPTLQTQRLTLRAFAVADVEPMHRLMQDPEVMQFVGDRRVPAEQDSWRAVAGWLGHWALRGYGQWAIEERASGELVGRAGVINPQGWPGAEVGYLLGKRWWGRGYATEAAQAALDWAFSERDFERLLSLIDPQNAASIRVAERLGETLRGESTLWEHTVLVYGIDRAEWEARRAG